MAGRKDGRRLNRPIAQAASSETGQTVTASATGCRNGNRLLFEEGSWQQRNQQRRMRRLKSLQRLRDLTRTCNAVAISSKSERHLRMTEKSRLARADFTLANIRWMYSIITRLLIPALPELIRSETFRAMMKIARQPAGLSASRQKSVFRR